MCGNVTGVYICGLAIADSTNGSRLVQGGDSGGPVYLPVSGGSSVQAEGLISGESSTAGTEVAFTMGNLLPGAFGVKLVHS